MLKTQIKQVQNVLYNKIFNLNSGGCGHFAYLFSKKLKKLNIPHKIVLCDTFTTISKVLETKEACSHVVVFIKDIGYIDGHITYKTKKELKDVYCYVKASKHFKMDNILQFTGWNTNYKTKNNLVISKAIKKYL